MQRSRAGARWLVVSLVLLVGCSTPHEVLGKNVVAGKSDNQQTLDEFYATSATFESKVSAFSSGSTTGGAEAVLRNSDTSLKALESAYAAWNPLVTAVLKINPDGLPKDELVSYRAAMSEWIAAQRTITDAMLRCGSDQRCMTTEQTKNTPRVIAATTKAQQAKAAFAAATR